MRLRAQLQSKLVTRPLSTGRGVEEPGMAEQHKPLIKTPRQLITVIILAFAVPVILIILLATYVVGGGTGGAGSDAMTPEAIAERLRPVGTVAFQATGGARTPQSGAAGAPKTGDAGGWAPRLRQGFDTLVKHAVEGFKAMPPKGGNPDLDSIEVARAVAYIGNQSGGKFKEPDAPSVAATAVSAQRSGEQVVKEVCGNCHVAGVGGAPRIGDRAAWTKRVSRGVDAVTASAIKGHAGMPARGGIANLTDPEMKAAVLYMFSSSVPVPSPAPATSAPTAGSAAGTVVAKADGAKIYASGCNACHAAGVAGAPKFGDKAAWAPRTSLGVDKLTATVIKGKGVMPPRGGVANASDAELRAAVEHMIAAVK
jgi:cytochrome c5